jgi:RNA polymerase sigma factor (sigma-70 family)
LRSIARDGDGELIEADMAACADAGNPEASLIRAETRDAVIRALDALADEERLVLEWKYVESLSVRDIAERLGRTEKAAEAILYRARISFRATYAREET